MRLRQSFLAGIGLTAFVVSSCAKSDGREKTYPVTGRVLAHGRPLEHATVVFHPLIEKGPDTPRPRGKVGPDGSFTLTTYDGNDGAPAGEYRVTVELWLSTGRPEDGPVNRLSPRFGKPETSGLTATVTAGKTELKPFELTQ